MSDTQSSLQLRDFTILAPKNLSSQSVGFEWIVRAHTQAEILKREPGFDPELFSTRLRKLLGHVGCNPEKIKERRHELDDFNHYDWERMQIFKLAQVGQGAGTKGRNDFYAQAVDQVFEKLYPTDCEAPAGIIHVTCTGYTSPSGAQKVVDKKEWNQSTEITHAYHMGCYAALPAVRLAGGMLSSPFTKRLNERIDIVHTELCTLHFDPTQHSAEQLVIQSLFADGFIRYSVEKVSGLKEGGLEILSVRDEIIPKSGYAMGWNLGDHGMQMNLSRDVPLLIGDYLRPYLDRLFLDAGLDYKEERASAQFAIHPGGPKIIERCAKLLELEPPQTQASQQILYHYGNMSSATLPHVWQHILNDSSISRGTLVVSLAFGPGLSLSGSLMRKI